MERLTFDVKKIEIVEISLIKPNSWNPKEENTEEFQKVVASLKTNGQEAPIVVREVGGEVPYEIIDGEQRYRAMKELGFTEAVIYNKGEVSDQKAKELTLWFQVQVPFSEIDLASLLTDMTKDYGTLDVPYDDDKIQEYLKLTNFDWDAYKNSEKDSLDENANGDQEFRTLSVKLTLEQYNIVRQALETIYEQEGEIGESRAIELICADFIGGR